ncbi:MAG: 2,3-cyclic 3-phosphodiesterase [Actinomycetota bacterium]|nr:2,3-cyclic 3-phosphodiesterase [Actinomycetota bacterium]
MRMFIALPLPEPVKEHLSSFLEPRQEAESQKQGLRWTGPEQWHLTLAFMSEVADRNTDELLERLERVASRRQPMSLRLAGAGAFPNPGRAKVLWAGVEHDGEELMRLAGGVRAAGSKSGIEVGGGRFHPHLTLARLPVATDVTAWLRVLDTYSGSSWQANEVALVASYLGQGRNGRSRHEVREIFPLGPPSIG